MESSDYMLWALLGGLLLLAGMGVALAAGIARSRDASRRDAQRLFEQMDICVGELRELSEAHAAALIAAADLRTRLEGERRAPAAAPPAARSYDIALRLARNGASREELMSNCGMSRHEAELAVRLHGPGRRAEPARLAATG